MKSSLIILFLLLLFSTGTYGESRTDEQYSLSQGVVASELHFNVSQFHLNNEGDLPSPQLVFPVCQNTSNTFQSNEKSRKLILDSFCSRLKTRYKLSIFQAFVFSGHSSALVHIFLKTACFRL